MRWYFMWFWSAFLLMVSNVKHVFICLLTICISSFDKYLFRSFTDILIGCWGFFVFILCCWVVCDPFFLLHLTSINWAQYQAMWEILENQVYLIAGVTTCSGLLGENLIYAFCPYRIISSIILHFLLKNF